MDTVNKFADEMLARINTIINDKMSSIVQLESGIVSSVNSNGSVNVYFPPENTTIFTNISNQSPFVLNPGDSVEVLLKNGNYSNCWVVAKHLDSYTGTTATADNSNQYLEKFF